MATNIKYTPILIVRFAVFCVFFHSTNATDESPDFIIVGGGTSGCVVASRLSEKYSVLLLEAGGYPSDLLDIPATAFPKLGEVPGISKTYKSVPQKNVALRSPTIGQVSFVIGTTLGGGSSINGMVHNRGSPFDYDNWANVTNDQSWNYKNLLKYFKRIEDYQGGFPSDENHGTGGPLEINRSKYVPGIQAWLAAGKWLGLKSNVDPNGPQVPSFTTIEYSRRKGRRVSAFTGYLKPFIDSRPNLKIVTQAEVKEIIFNEDNTRAIGIRYVSKNTNDDGIEHKTNVIVFANKEVIISAGVMDSPAILMRSGIGPEDVLKKCNISPVKILPVGYNLQDHLTVKLEMLISKNASQEVLIGERDLTPENLKYFEETGEGPYSSLGGIAGQAFLVSEIRKQEINPNPEWPDMHFLQMHSAEKLKLLAELERDNEETDLSVYVLPILTRPKSKGRVTLNLDDIDDQPVIDFRYLSDPDGHDISIVLEGVRMAVKIYEEAPSFKKLGGRLSKVPYENCAHFEFRSDEYWRCFIRDMTSSGLHAGGTCRMGSGENDKNAVVDSELKVIGIDGLRVVDCSVMPNVVNVNTQAAAYVIAEKAADMILQDYENMKDEL